MKLNITVDIDRPIDDVWTLLAEDFTSIAAWYDPVVRSYELPSTPVLEGASCAGRVCEFTEDPDGLKAVEEIVEYDAEGRRLSIDVRVENAGALLPVARNHATFWLERLDDGGTRVHFEATPTLKPHGLLLYPLLKHGLTKSFRDLLIGMKTKLESAVPVRQVA